MRPFCPACNSHEISRKCVAFFLTKCGNEFCNICNQSAPLQNESGRVGFTSHPSEEKEPKGALPENDFPPSQNDFSGQENGKPSDLFPDRYSEGKSECQSPAEASCPHPLKDYACMDPRCRTRAYSCAECIQAIHFDCDEKFFKRRLIIVVKLRKFGKTFCQPEKGLGTGSHLPVDPGNGAECSGKDSPLLPTFQTIEVGFFGEMGGTSSQNLSTPNQNQPWVTRKTPNFRGLPDDPFEDSSPEFHPEMTDSADPNWTTPEEKEKVLAKREKVAFLLSLLDAEEAEIAKELLLERT